MLEYSIINVKRIFTSRENYVIIRYLSKCNLTAPKVEFKFYEVLCMPHKFCIAYFMYNLQKKNKQFEKVICVEFANSFF